MNLLVNLMKAQLRVLLVGPPGIAKTARILWAAKAAGFEVVIVRASMSERVDIGGAFVPDLRGGIARILPLEWLHKLQQSKKPTLLFFDDLGQAPMEVQASIMKLFDEGVLPDNVLIWGATNRPGDKAGVSALCEPLRSRFHVAFSIDTPKPGIDATRKGTQTIGHQTGVVEHWGMDKGDQMPLTSVLQPWHGMRGTEAYGELTDWCQWAFTQNAAPEIIAWHLSTTGRTLYQWKPHADPAVRMPDYRSWHTVIRLWNSNLRDLHTIAAAIGYPAAVEFLAFAELANKLPTPDQVRMDPYGATIPQDAGGMYLIASMLIAAAEPRDAKPFVQYMTRLPRVYAALLGRGLEKQLGPKLTGQKEWVKWQQENADLFL